MPEVRYDPELFAFMAENLPEVRLMRDKIREASRSNKEQSQRICDMIAGEGQAQAMGLPKPRIWQPSGSDIWSFAFFAMLRNASFEI